MKITVYELIGLMKDGKAPERIKVNNIEFELIDGNYYREGEAIFFKNNLFSELAFKNITLNDKVEIISEEKEWEDIEECHSEEGLVFSETALEYKINQLIKNQKYLKEKLESKNE